MSEVPVILGRKHNERHEDNRWFKFDFTINITTLIAAAALIASIASYGNKIVSYLGTQNSKINIMWSHWYQDNHSLLSADERRMVEILNTNSIKEP